MNEPSVYTVEEVAELFRLTPGGVRKMIRENKWPTPVIRLGSRQRIPAGPVHRLLKESRSAAPGSGPAAVEPGAAVSPSTTKARHPRRTSSATAG